MSSLWVRRAPPRGELLSITYRGIILAPNKNGDWMIAEHDGEPVPAIGEWGWHDLVVRLIVGIMTDLQCSYAAAASLIDEALGADDPFPFEEELMAG